MKPRKLFLFAAVAATMSLPGCGDSNQAAPVSETKTAASVTATAAPTSVSAAGLTKVSEIRVGRTIYEYVFRVAFQNSGPQLTDGKAQITAAGVGTTVVDGAVTVGSLPAGASSTPSDTITLRHDRSFQFDPAALKWQITGTPVVVPPGDIPGTDANNDGVRDDVAAFITSQYGSNPTARAAAMQYARLLQKKLTAGPTEIEGLLSASARSMFCLFDTLGSEGTDLMVYNIRNVQLDSEQRLAAFLEFEKNSSGRLIPAPSADTPRSTCE